MCIRHMDLCFGNTTSNYLRGIKLFAYLFFLQKALLFPFGQGLGKDSRVIKKLPGGCREGLLP